MKIKIFLLIILICLSINYTNLIMLKKYKNQKANEVILDSIKIETIKDIIKTGLKSGIEFKEGSPIETCLTLMTQMKYMKNLVNFWEVLKRIFDITSPRPFMKHSDYKNFIHNSGMLEKLENGTTCEDLIQNSLAYEEELENKGRTMKNVVQPLLESNYSLKHNEKTFITAFTGIHRFTKESETLIPKLNAKSK